jgi:hypothetical protein
MRRLFLPEKLTLIGIVGVLITVFVIAAIIVGVVR